MSGNMRSQAIVRWTLALMLAIAGVMAGAVPAQAQHTSAECPAQTATVTAGGTVTIDVTNCTSLIGLVGIGPVDGGSYPVGPPYNFPDHGSANTRRVGSQWFLDYSHNGTTGIGSTDVFEMTDGDGNGDVLVTITINPSASPISVSPATLSTLTAGTLFSQTLTATGGASPYTYTLQSGALPIGGSLSSGGVLSGTPTQRGAYSFSVRATDSTTPTAQFADKGYTGTVQNPTLALVANTGAAIQGVSFSQTLSTNGGVAPYAYQLETGAFPSGISISSAGVVSGTTIAGPGSYPVTIRVTDASTGTGIYFEVESFTLTVGPPPSVSIAVSPSSVNEDGATNLTYTVTRSQNLASATTVNLTTSGTATSGTDYTGAVSTVTIPAGATTATVTIDPTADATVEANETVSLTVATGTGYTVGAPSIATGTITNDEGTSAYPGCATRNVTVANGGTVRVDLSTCHFFGLGVLQTAPTNGTATAGPGPVNYYDYTHNGNSATSDRFVVLDDNSATIVVNVTINAPTSSIVVSPASLAAMTAGTVFTETLSSTGGTGPYTYSVSTGAFPTGLSVTSAGVIFGTPTQRGSYSVGIRSQDSLGAFTVKGYTGTVAPATLTLASGTGTAIQGVAFTQALATTNGVAPFAFQLETGTLPTGITLSAAGVLSGTTSAAVGPYAVTIRVTDSSTGTGTNFQLQPFTLTVSPPPTVSIAASPVSLNEDDAPNATFTVTRSLNLSSPTIVNLTTAGTATSGTDYTGAVATVTIPAGATTATVTIDPTADSTIEPDETVTLVVAAGTGYTVGTPTNATTTILNDDVPTISIAASPTSVTEDGAQNMAYTVTLSGASNNAITVGYTISGTATNGTDYATLGGALVIPAGNATGTITVDPAVDSSLEPNETVILTLATGTGYTVGTPNAATGTITNDDVPVTVSPGSLPNGTVAAAYSQTVTASGGTAPYGFAVTAGTQPAGLTLSSVGVLSGTPTAGGTFNFTVTATDAAGAPGPFSGSQAYTMVVTPPTIVLSATPLAGGTLGAAYSAAITPASGGTAPYAYAVTAGALPGGLTLSTATGAITGSPSALGAFNFSITATDNSTGTGPYTATQAYAIAVIDNPPIAGGSSLTVAYNAAATNVPLTITGGTATSLAIATSATNGTAIATGTTITYQPTAGFAGTDSFTYTATNSGGTSVPATVTVTVQDPVVTITPSGGFAAAVATAYTQTFTFNGGATPWSSYQVANLPSGLSITGTTANSVTVSGTPSAAGSFNLNVSATDSSTGNGPYTVGQSFALTVGAPTLSLAPGAGILTAPYAAAYTQSFTASGGTGPYTYGVTGSLPAGLTFSGDTLSGTPTAPGSYPITVTATDTGSIGTGAPFTVTQNYTLDVPSPTIALAPASLPGGTAAVAYAQTISATGGVSPLSFTVSSGALPAGITLSSSGSLSGTPTEVGSFIFSITATDTNGQSGSRSYGLAIAAPILALTPAPGGFNVVYGGTVSQNFTASGGNGSYSYTVSGSLPAGITLDTSSGALSGSTIAVGTFNFTITATDTGTTGAGAPFTVARSYTLTVAAPVIVLTPASIPGATVGSAYSSSLSASGGAEPYSFAVTAGALPAGLTLSSTGVLSGTPTAGGPFNFTVTASDSSAAPGPFSANQAYTLIVAAPVVILPTTSLPGGTRDTGYSATLNPASGGTAPFDYAVTGGGLPTGLMLSSSGILSGTPTIIGSFSFTVTATDSSTGAGPYSATRSYTLTITDQVPIAGGVAATLTYGAAATPITLNLSGGAATSVVVATAPGSGTATVTGTTISYQPDAGFSGNDSFTYTATNGGGTSTPATVTITVGAPTLSVTASSPLNAVVGAPYSQIFTFAGGTAPFGSQQIGGLPAGLALTGTTSNSVTLSGTPRSQGTFTLSVSASDSSTGNGPFVASDSFVLTVAPPVLALAPASGSFTANYAAPFSQSVTVSGGIGPYSYALGGSLPAGVTFDPATGIISGTPTATGNFAYTITATDSGATGPGAPFNVEGSYTLAVAVPTIAVTPATLPAATAGTAYAATLVGSGAVAPYGFTLTSGELPAGVMLSDAGELAGTPTASGSFPFVVTVRDANGQTGTASLTLAVDVATIAITPATLPAAVQGIAYSQTVTASGGVAPYGFVVSAGALPAGLSLNPTTGAITGTPTASGTASFSITVTDSTAGTAAVATIAYVLQITARPDPANDPEVRGLVQAQVMASRRFADVQVNNFMRRLEGMHGNAGGSGGGGFQNSLRFSTPGYCQDSVTALTNAACARSQNKFGQVAAAHAGENGGAGNGGGSGQDANELPWTVWAGGNVRFGDRDPATGRLSQKFESEGITFGTDYRFSQSFAAGIGVGLGRDTVDVGDNGSRSRGEAKTVAIYGSHALGSAFYLDWLGGYQALDFDLRRFVTPTGLMVNSTRSGRQWFATASTGADIETGNWLVTPYARIDLTRGRLNGYTENSGSLFDLTFLDQDVDFTALGLGTRINYRHLFTDGALLPRLRVEYQYDVERNADARVAYFDRISGPFSTISLTGLAREQLMLGAGAELQLGTAVAFDFEYLNRIASGSGSDQSVQVGVKVQF